jgi:hypothetical protein
MHLSKMYKREDMRQMTSVGPDGLASALLDKDEHSGGWHAWERRMASLKLLSLKLFFFKPREVSSLDQLREPIRSIDQLYLQAKSMVPYLSRLVQVWAPKP